MQTKLTRAEIAAMTAPQLRLAVAELMGWRWQEGNDCEILSHKEHFGTGAVRENGVVRFGVLPDYPGGIGAAWLVLEHVAAQWKWWELSWRPIGCVCNLTGNGVDSAYEATPATAICRAALYAALAAESEKE